LAGQDWRVSALIEDSPGCGCVHKSNQGHKWEAATEQAQTPLPISPLALEAIRRIDALFEIERTISGQQRTAVVSAKSRARRL
jgi:hypothetical protein